MPPRFGTSGLRGLVSDLTEPLVATYTRAFLQACDTGEVVCVGQDLRPSSPEIASHVAVAAQAAGYRVVDCGALPTPALALAARRVGGSAVMVTGSHIPEDRNGLKFYVRAGEITKADETAILDALETPLPNAASSGSCEEDDQASARFVARYLDAFAADALGGRRIGVYTHSAVGRDLLMQILSGLGAEVIELGRSEYFIPVDTEAVAPAVRRQISEWVKAHQLDALVSTDGDSDRPLLADETGRVVSGDILGQITAEGLKADEVVTPISSNSGVQHKGFHGVHLTRIGSPYVIAGMKKAGGRVVGYEANGGFLLGFDAKLAHGELAELMTRDCVLPLLMPLVMAGRAPLSARIAREPDVVTISDRLQEIPLEQSRKLVGSLSTDFAARAAFLGPLGVQEKSLDLTDGVRIILSDGCVVHIRPSGNAPELRLYVEARTAQDAEAIGERAIAQLKTALTA